jgi:lipoprotein signal peptidase
LVARYQNLTQNQGASFSNSEKNALQEWFYLVYVFGIVRLGFFVVTILLKHKSYLIKRKL